MEYTFSFIGGKSNQATRYATATSSWSCPWAHCCATISTDTYSSVAPMMRFYITAQVEPQMTCRPCPT